MEADPLTRLLLRHDTVLARRVVVSSQLAPRVTHRDNDDVCAVQMFAQPAMRGGASAVPIATQTRQARV